MYEKRRIAVPFNRAGIKEASELAIPKEKLYAGNALMIKYHLFGMKIKLLIEAPYFRKDKDQHQYNRYQPS